MQDADQRPVGDDGGTAVGQERHRHTGQRDEAHDTAGDDEDLEGEGAGQADGEELAEGVAGGEGGAHAALHDQAVDQQDRHDAGQAQFLAEGGEDEVGVGGEPDQVRVALAEAGAEGAAGAEGPQRLHGLLGVAGHLRLAERVLLHRVEPGLDALLDVRFEAGHADGAGRGHQQTEDDPAGPLGGDVQHDDEHSEEQQRGAEVGLEDQDQDRDEPDDQDRAEVAAARQVQAHEAAAGEGERVPLHHQVAGEEDRQHDLRELTGLDGAEAGDADPDLGAVDVGAEAGTSGSSEQEQGAEHGDVGVALQDAVVLEEDQHDDEQGDAQRGVQQLAGAAAPA